MNIAETLAATPVSDLDLTRYALAAPTTTVSETVDAMNADERSLACIVSEDKLVGVFTQRDVLNRVLGRPRIWDHPIGDEMTRAVRTMKIEQAVADGLAIMNDWWVRSVPVLEDDDRFAGSLSYYEVMVTIARVVAAHIDDVDRGVEDRHGLTLIDFTGLNTSPPVSVSAADTVDVAAHHMMARGIGSVLVVDDHGHLEGMLTEFDLQKKIGCEQEDLGKVTVGAVMTPDPIALKARSPIADAIQRMADRGFSHLPLLGESGRPVAVASFRDIAAYMEVSFAALG